MQLIINKQKFTDNSREVDNKSIFVVSQQNKKFQKDAIDKGCIRIVQAKDLKNYLDMSSIKIIGITGTNGKTTTSSAICSILLDLGYKVALLGTRGLFINNKQVESYSLTTPVQLALFSHIQKAMSESCDFFVMEVSSHAIEQKRVEGLDFALKVHTNITRDHLDYHKTIDEYIRVKNSFFEDESKKLINKDDDVVKYNMKNSMTYALENPATYRVNEYSFKDKSNVIFSHFGEKYTFISPLAGIFNIYNLIAAISSVHILTKRDLTDICKVVENFKGVSGRMEIVSTKPLAIVDFAHTPDGMEEVLKSFANKDIICVFGAGGNRDKDKRPLMGEVASKYSKHIIVTSDNPRFEEPNGIIDDILEGIKDNSNVIVQVDRKKAIKKAISIADENSVILVLGKGDEPMQLVYDKKIPFSDKEEILKSI